jgi:hypothetical protein
MADSVEIAYDKADLRRVLGAFKAMDEEATVQAKAASGALAEFAQDMAGEDPYDLRCHEPMLVPVLQRARLGTVKPGRHSHLSLKHARSHRRRLTPR